jgi:hypothetical protein
LLFFYHYGKMKGVGNRLGSESLETQAEVPVRVFGFSADAEGSFIYGTDLYR